MHEKQYRVVILIDSEYNTEDEDFAGDRRKGRQEGRQGTVLCLHQTENRPLSDLQ